MILITTTCNLLSFPIPNPNFSAPNTRREIISHCHRGSGESEWDSNAESYRFRFRDDEGGEFKRTSSRKWWSDGFDNDPDDDFDLFGVENEDDEDFWDKFWIFKIFRSYGYMLPAIIVSMVFGTGPQTFIMALALPFVQSTISLVVDKLWGSSYEEASRRNRYRTDNRRKPFSERSNANFRNKENEEASNEEKEKDSYKSWGSMDSSKRTQRSKFGGWDELNNQNGPTRKESDTKFVRANDNKLSRRRKYKDQPLFLRLLIAVFPFLGSWTRIL